MPQPILNLPAGTAARGGNNIILERSEHAKLLGAITAVWGEIDGLFLDIFNVIAFAKAIPVGAHSHSDLSPAIFSFFINYRSKSDVILKILRIKYPDKVKKFEEISQDIQKKAKPRNTIVHCSWQICDDYPDDLIHIKDQQWIRYTVRDFEDILERSNEVKNELVNFYVGTTPLENVAA